MGKLAPRQAELTVVGIQHRVTMSTRRMMIDHLPITVALVREPENAHDEDAIKVVVNEKGNPYNKLHIGYVKATEAAVWAEHLDWAIYCEETETRPDFILVGAWLTELRPQDGEGTLLVKVKARVDLSLEIRGKEIS